MDKEGSLPEGPQLSSDESLQEDLERSSLHAGIANYRERLVSLRDTGDEGATPPATKLIRVGIQSLTEEITRWVQASKEGPGRRAAALPLVEAADPQVAALITLRCLLGATPRQRALQGVARTIGGQIEDELRLSAWDRNDSRDWERANEYISESPWAKDPASGKRYRRMALVGMASRKYVWAEWSTEQKTHVGLALIDCAIRGTGLFEIAQRTTLSGVLTIRVKEDAQKWIEEAHAKCELLHPVRLPMVCRPLPFTKADDGGYRLPLLRRRIVRDGRKTGGMIDRTAADAPLFFKAVNALQDSRWQVNRFVFETAEQLWNLGRDMPGACLRDDLPLPERPVETAPDDEQKVWKTKAREIYFRNVGERGRRIATAETLSIARRLLDRPLYFPMYADFRGRLYTACSHLTPQGSDLSKGLLTFKRAEPLGRTGRRWLAFHVANCFGQDKIAFDDRIAWTEANSAMIRACGEDPLRNPEWMDADGGDNAFVALAACREWAMLQQHLDAGGSERDFKSSLPVTVDGSCNGIQHLAALSRDKDAGAEVNLIPGDKPADIYKRVAAVSTQLAEGFVANPRDAKDSKYGPIWLKLGIVRGLTKRPTMILPYGGTIDAVTKYVIAWAREAKVTDAFGAEISQACGWMSAVIWEAMNVVVKGPREIMQWTRKVAAAVTKTQQAITWKTPSGFVVRMAIPSTVGRRIKTRLGDQIVKLTLLEETDKLSSNDMRQGLAPNWIHSLDAAALALTICRLIDQGVVDIMAIHDSYGTHAGSMSVMASTLREVFVEMYREDILGQFVQQVAASAPGAEIPPPPPLGDLDVEQVLESTYFFA